MVNFSDYKDTYNKLFRDLLRGVNPDGTTNSYTTTVHHPSDYESDRTTLKPSSDWVDPRTWIIIGKKKTETNSPIISISHVDLGETSPASQGGDCYDIDGAIWQVLIDTSSVKDTEQRFWKDKISQQVLNSFIQNQTTLLQNFDFVSLNYNVVDVSSDQMFIDRIQIRFDGILNV